jgi:membrane protease YdiL (CAAX protease family)
LVGILMPFIWRRGRPRVLGLTAVIVFVVIVNALVTGVLASVEDRYQGRVIWLVPLLAAVFVLEWLDHRTRPDCRRVEARRVGLPNLSDF